MAAKESDLNERFFRLIAKQNFVTIRHTSVSDKVYEAARAFHELGPSASNAVPGLVSIFNDPRISWSNEPKVAEILGNVGPSAHQAVPLLATKLTNSAPARRSKSWMEEWTRINSATALGEIRGRSDIAVPALMAALNDNSPNLQAAAARALGKFGTNARPALSRLQELLNVEKDSRHTELGRWSTMVLWEQLDLSSELIRALQKIKPEATTETGIEKVLDAGSQQRCAAINPR